MSLDELEKAAEAPEGPVELQKDMVRRHWKEYTIRDALWHVRDAWREVMPNCIWGAWKKLCPDLAVDFGGFDLSEGLSRECLKCLELARKVNLDEVEEDDVDSLDRRGAVDGGPGRSGEAAASVGGGGGGWAAPYDTTEEVDDD